MSALNIALIVLGPFMVVGVLLLAVFVGSLLDKKDVEVALRVGELQVKAAEAQYMSDLEERQDLERLAKKIARLNAERRSWEGAR